VPFWQFPSIAATARIEPKTAHSEAKPSVSQSPDTSADFQGTAKKSRMRPSRSSLDPALPWCKMIARLAMDDSSG
jgi:hypothetical protein